eukprot:s3813_g3.t1
MFGALAEWFGLSCSCEARPVEAAEIEVTSDTPEAVVVKGVTTPTTTTGAESFGDPSPVSVQISRILLDWLVEQDQSASTKRKIVSRVFAESRERASDSPVELDRDPEKDSLLESRAREQLAAVRHRQALRAPDGSRWHIVLTPDGDVYPEQISLENDDLSAYRIGVGDVLPHGLHAGNTYRIRNLPQGQALQQMLLDARHAAAVQAFPPGAGPGLAAPPNPPPAVGAVREADDGRVWVRIETCGDHLRGEIVLLSGNEILHGDVGLKEEGGVYYAIRRMPREEVASFKGKEASADARLLGVTFQGVSREERTWRDVSKEIIEEKFEDWALPGPRTASWCTRFLNRRGGGPVEHHRWWVSNHGLRADGWGVAEHEQLMKILDKLGRYDGLDLSNLAGAELAFRRLQLIEYFPESPKLVNLL